MTQARDLADGKFDTDTLVVSASNDRVGVNNASPDTTMKVNFSSASTAGFGINDTNSGNLGGMLQFYSGSDNGTLRANIMNANNAGAHMALGTSGTVVFGGTSYVAANALDDYEEGTFTPAPTVGTVNLADAAYTKVGRKVTVHFNAYTFSDRSSTSHIEFTNLPYTADSSIGSTANSGMHRYINAGDSLAFYIPRNQSKIQLFSLNSGSGWTPTQYSHLNSTSAEMYVHLTYFTAS